MKRILILLFVGLLVLSCNNTSNQSEEQESVKWEIKVNPTNNRCLQTNQIKRTIDSAGEISYEKVALYIEDTDNTIFLHSINLPKAESKEIAGYFTNVEITFLDGDSKQVDKYSIIGDMPSINNDIIITDEKSKDYILNKKGYVIFSFNTITGVEEIKVPTYANNKETEKDK